MGCSFFFSRNMSQCPEQIFRDCDRDRDTSASYRVHAGMLGARLRVGIDCSFSSARCR
jgi:hypothetical protein